MSHSQQTLQKLTNHLSFFKFCLFPLELVISRINKKNSYTQLYLSSKNYYNGPDQQCGSREQEKRVGGGGGLLDSEESQDSQTTLRTKSHFQSATGTTGHGPLCMVCMDLGRKGETENPLLSRGKLLHGLKLL